MSFLSTMDISASGLTAQRLRLDTIASNIANAETTRSPDGTGAYRRQAVVMQAVPSEADSFSGYLRRHMKGLEAKNVLQAEMGQGVRVTQIKSFTDAEAPFRLVYDPGHPDADEEGYVAYPNVNIIEEMVNMISANRSYEANAKVIESTKAMAMKALEIGR
jgi:flagellar basal-body rod protein FlgC